MKKSNQVNVKDKESKAVVSEEKMRIPEDVQKNILEFFMRTSIPRKKANNKNHLSNKENGR